MSRGSGLSDRTGVPLPLLAAMLAVCCWGIGPLLVKAISASSTTISLYRMWVAVPVALLVCRLSGNKLTVEILRRSLPAGALFAFSIVCGFASFQHTSVANATLIGALTPVLVLLVAGRLFGERVTRRDLSFAALSMLGVLAVVLGASKTAGASFYGDMLAVANLIGFTVYFLEVKRQRTRGIPSAAYLAGIMLTGALVLTPYALLTSHDLGAIGGTDWLWIILMVLIPGTVGHGLMNWAQGQVDVTILSLMTLANPVISTVGAWIVYDESLAVVQVLGAMVVLVGLGGVVVGHQGMAPKEVVEVGEPAM